MSDGDAVPIRVACEGCGLVHDRATEALQQMEEVREENAALRDEIGRLSTRVRQLRGEQVRRIQQDKHYPAAIRVLEYWQARCMPSARELTGKRVEHAIARLRGGYTEEDLRRAIDGYAAYPYVTSRGRRSEGVRSAWQADAELILRTPEHVDRGLRMADTAEEQGQAMATPPGGVAPAQNGNGLSALGQQAVKYATIGWHVFPCVPDGKPPATAKGLLNASTDLERITRYWRQAPNANLAVRTGQESGLVVLDVDGTTGYETLMELQATRGPLPQTLSCVTPRGGQHFYFRHPGVEIRNTQGVPGPGLDIRGDGGYVLAPPSRVDGKPYEPDDQVPVADMPEWLVKGLLERQARSNGRVDPEEWESIVTLGVREGERNGQLTRLAGYLVNKHTPGFALGMLQTVNQQRCVPPLPSREVEGIMDSILRMRARERR